MIASKVDHKTSLAHCCECGEPLVHYHFINGPVALVCADCWDEIENGDDLVDDLEISDEGIADLDEEEDE